MSPALGPALILVLLGAVAAGAQETAENAYQRKDFAAAREQWLEAAKAGSAQAKLGLGLLADRGLGEPQDPEKAFTWYLDAAHDGLAEAQFNVGVMLDAGIGTPRDRDLALLWYSRAALRGHPRAQYNLGLLYATGDGAPRNADLAAYWFGMAAQLLPAAQARLDAPSSDAAAVAAGSPRIALSRIEPAEVELVWSSPAAPGFAGYRVEIVSLPGTQDYADSVLDLVTEASGILADGLVGDSDLRWRVSQLVDGGADYVASPWQGGEDDTAPKGRVNFVVSAGDPRMSGVASAFAADLRKAGYWVRLTGQPDGAEDPLQETSVAYAYESDRDLAAKVAAFLPVLSAEDTVHAAPGSTLPGEVRVLLAGAPTPTAN